MIGQMDHWQHVVGEWAEKTFPDQTDERVIAHLGEEMDELIEAVVNGEEPVLRDGLADCLILLLCLAHRHGVAASDAVGAKHAINERRRWRFDVEKGYDTHTG